MEYELTVNDIVNKIFTKPPLPPCTYALKLSFENENTIEVNMFHFLMKILIDGAKILYGEDITPNQISPYQFDILKQYILSLGYELKHNYTYLDDDNTKPYKINIWFEPYKQLVSCNGTTKYS
jgi:hypothetical protein